MSEDLKLPKLPDAWRWGATSGSRGGVSYLTLRLCRGEITHSSVEVSNPTKKTLMEAAEIMVERAGEHLAARLNYQMFTEML